MNPRVTDNDGGEITVTLDGKELRGWSYKTRGEQREKMLQAREYVEGWGDAAAALSLQDGKVWPHSRRVPEDWRPVPIDGLQKIMALLPPPPLTQDGLTHRFEGPNPHDTIYAIRAAFIELLAVPAMVAEHQTSEVKS